MFYPNHCNEAFFAVASHNFVDSDGSAAALADEKYHSGILVYFLATLSDKTFLLATKKNWSYLSLSKVGGGCKIV